MGLDKEKLVFQIKFLKFMNALKYSSRCSAFYSIHYGSEFFLCFMEYGRISGHIVL
jgi:hypothetical protein